MLERFDRITNVGLFRDYVHSAGCEFGDITLVFGENGVGKSTLSAVLDSLRENNPEELIRRRTLPGDVPPKVTVRLDGKDYTFDGKNWDAQPPYDVLDIFHPGFVNRNVHAATSVDTDHRRNLCEFVLGRKAVEKVARLTQVDADGRVALTEIKRLDGDLQLLLKAPDTPEKLLDLPRDPNIEQKLENVRAELKTAQNRDAISARVVPEEVVLPQINRDAIIQMLAKSEASIKAGATEIVKTHIKDHLNRDGEVWLGAGAGYIETDTACPFCAQDTSTSNLVAAIRSYFSDEYRNFYRDLSLDIQTVRERLGSASFPDIRAKITAQIAVAAQWEDIVPIDQSALSDKLNEAEIIWKSGVIKLGEVVANKQANPLDKIDPLSADDAICEYKRSLGILGDVNTSLVLSRKGAEKRKADLSKADAEEIEQRLFRLENQKVWFEPLAQNLSRKKAKLLEKRKEFDKEKILLKEAINDRATSVVGKYQKGINHYLAFFGCDIQLESVKANFPAGRASVQYKLMVQGHEIKLGLSETEPCFETVLSDGDKYTLALAFFFARLKDFDCLAGRVIVFDDPVNSLGGARRTFVEKAICELRSRDAQVVVLTHDERLAAIMWQDKQLKNPVSLQVERTRKGSNLMPWDVENATQSEYVKDYITIVGFLENGGDHGKVSGRIRPYLEQRLRHLFPGAFKARDTLGIMIGRIRKSHSGSPLFALNDKLADISLINDAALPSHHATDGVLGMDPLSPEEVRLYAEKVLNVLG